MANHSINNLEELLAEKARLRTQIEIVQEEMRVSAGRTGVSGGSGHIMEQSANAYGLKLGQRVRHKIFGEGVVLHMEGQGEHSRVQVNFEADGVKWLVAAYANLEASG